MKKENKAITLFLILLISVQTLYCSKNSNLNSSKSKTEEKLLLQANSNIKFESNSRNKLQEKLNYKFSTSSSLALTGDGKEKEKDKIIDFDHNTGKSSIWQGWIKYLHFSSERKFTQPKDFFVNNSYFRQRIEKVKLLEKGALPNEKNDPSNNLFINIPSKFHFFATLNNNYLQINGDRINPLTSHLESLNLEMIDPVHVTDMEKTGLKELGKFDEGICFDLSTHALNNYVKDFMPTPGDFKKSVPFHWIICLEEEEQYKSLVDNLTSILVAKESLRERPEAGKGEAVKEKEANEEHYEGIDANPLLDGYLIKINDWTQCTLKCGGGWSFQQWKCISPKEGGKPCIGDLIRKKKCNEDPCPQIGIQGSSSPNSTRTVEEVTADPIVKSAFVFSRPQQNIDGVIREEDVLHEYYDLTNGKTSLPSRLILNSNSISLYSDLEENKTLFSWDLLRTKLVKVAGQDCCFFLRNENIEHKICGMTMCKTFVSSWIRSYDLFKAKKYEAKDVQPQDPLKGDPPVDPHSGTGDGDLAMTMEMDESSANAKQKAISDKMQSKLTAKSIDNVNETQKDALRAINREIDIEELIRKEEMIRTQEKIKNKLEEFRKEEQKKQKLEDALAKQKDSHSTVVSELKTKQDILEIKKDTEKDVLERRKILKKKLQKIRVLADRKSKIIQNKINIIRNKMTKELVAATKSGNPDTCKNAVGNDKLMDSYCDENIIDDINQNLQCKDKDNFCFSCCDTEFGSANIVGKDQCYSICLSKEGLKGDWKKNPKLEIK